MAAAQAADETTKRSNLMQRKFCAPRHTGNSAAIKASI
jgi:hypothetical protein